MENFAKAHSTSINILQNNLTLLSRCPSAFNLPNSTPDVDMTVLNGNVKVESVSSSPYNVSSRLAIFGVKINFN